MKTGIPFGVKGFRDDGDYVAGNRVSWCGQSFNVSTTRRSTHAQPDRKQFCEFIMASMCV
jgi:hypothetical protein